MTKELKSLVDTGAFVIRAVGLVGLTAAIVKEVTKK